MDAARLKRQREYSKRYRERYTDNVRTVAQLQGELAYARDEILQLRKELAVFLSP